MENSILKLYNVVYWLKIKMGVFVLLMLGLFKVAQLQMQLLSTFRGTGYHTERLFTIPHLM